MKLIEKHDLIGKYVFYNENYNKNGIIIENLHFNAHEIVQSI